MFLTFLVASTTDTFDFSANVNIVPNVTTSSPSYLNKFLHLYLTVNHLTEKNPL